MKQKTLLFSWLLAMLFSIVGASPAWGDEVYQKVTSAPSDWSGEYLIVYETGSTGYVWTGVDASSNFETASISNSKITKPSKAVSVIIASITGGYSIMVNGGTNNGKYISGTKDSNTINFGISAVANTLTYSSGVDIVSNTSHFVYNSTSGTTRYRYYKSTTYSGSVYKRPQLYKRVYTVTYDANGGTGTMTDSNSPYAAGATVNLLVNAFSAPAGKAFNSWAVTDGSSNAVIVTNNQFTMPASNVTVTAQWQATGDYITASPTIKNMTSADGDAEFTITTDQTLDENPTQFYTTADGDVTTTKPSWITEALYDEGTLLVSVAENTGAARTAYFRVEKGSVKSDVITINQAAITVATPAFDVAAGTYYEDQLVDITCETEGATIYYTTDGSTPTSASTEYDGEGVEISANATLKAIAIKNGVSSEVASAAYTIIHPLTTMDAIFEAATTAGSTAASHYVTFNNWVVTGVKNSQAFVTDGTKGFIIYKNGHGFAVGNILSGTVQASLQLYQGSAEFTTLTSSTSGLTVTTGGTVSPYVTTIDALSGVNTGALIQLKGVTYNGTILEDASENTITPYTTLYTGSYTNGTKYNIIGVYQQQSSAPHRILPRSSADIVEVTDPTITVASSLAVPNYVVGTAEPTYETLTVNGSYLTADITLSLGESSNFEMSTDLETWTNSLTLTETDGSVTDEEVAIRLKAGLSKGAYEGTLTLSSTGATNAVVSLSGSVTGQTYAIGQYTAPATAHGTITFSPESPIAEDATVTLTATPSEGYTFTANSWVIYKESAGDFVVDNSITVTENQFTMPAYAIYVDGTFTAIAVTGVTLNKSTASIGVGDTETLSATIAPTNALNKTVTWTSDNTSVATVNAATGVVTGVAVGSATITATTADGSFTATCDVTVENVVTFTSGTDVGSTTTNADGDEVTKSVITITSSCAAFATAEYRLYSGSTTTISTNSGKITKIEFTKNGSYSLSNLSKTSGSTGSYDSSTGTWTGVASSIAFSASAQVRLDKIKVFVANTATPTFSVAAGEYDEAKSVTISCATDGAAIYYTTDGTTPTSSSTAYSSAIDITTTTTLKAIAIKNDVESDVASATYTMNRPAAPTFDVAAGVFDAAFGLHLSTETDGATIYYTTDGTTPTSSSSTYSTKIAISAATTTVKAIAMKNGLTSDVASATYTYDSRTTPTFTLSTTSLDLKVNETSSAVTLTTNSDVTPSFTCADAHVTLTGTDNSRTISANAAGTYTVNVSVTGSAIYKDAEGTITVTVTKKATTMVLTPSFTSKDLHVTTFGSLIGVPQYNSSNIAGAEVTYSSSDETVATIAANGTVTFRKAGSTTITASYAGNDEYEACEESYVLNLTDSTPQEPVVEITPNYTFFGKDAQFSGSTYNELTGEKNNVSVTYTRNSGSTYANTTAMRFYKDNKLTIAAPTGYHIIGITLSLTGSSSDITADQESYNAGTGVWSGDASSVTFTRPSNASSYATISKITVTLGSTVTLNSACFGGVNYYGTYSNGNAFVVPEGLRVSAITYNTTTKKIELDNYSTGDIVAAGEGVLVSSTTYGNHTVALSNETGTSKSGNLLVGTGDSGATASDMSDTNYYYYYRLTMKDDKPGFWWKTAEGAGFALAANRAYLKVSKETAASARGFNLFNDEDETTGIHSIENGKLTMENGAWYTLGGQKMNGKPATKGIYIINGKKVVVK